MPIRQLIAPISMAALAFLLSACGSLPLSEGTYETEVAEVTDNSCPFTDDDYGVGEVDLTTVTWPDDNTLRLSGGEGRRDYAFDGTRGFTAEDTEREPIEEGDPCYLVIDSEFLGEVLSETSFGLENEFTFSVDGDCSQWDTTGFPCGGSIWLEGNLRE